MIMFWWIGILFITVFFNLSCLISDLRIFAWISKTIQQSNLIKDENGDYDSGKIIFYSYSIGLSSIGVVWCCYKYIKLNEIAVYCQKMFLLIRVRQIPIITYDKEKQNMEKQCKNNIKEKDEGDMEMTQPHNIKCAICLEDLAVGERLRMLPCFHGFHTKCFDPWFSLGKSTYELCPMCKQNMFHPEYDIEVLPETNY
eukprot:228669_1